jgi:hypothetical protein
MVKRTPSQEHRGVRVTHYVGVVISDASHCLTGYRQVMQLYIGPFYEYISAAPSPGRAGSLICAAANKYPPPLQDELYQVLPVIH